MVMLFGLARRTARKSRKHHYFTSVHIQSATKNQRKNTTSTAFRTGVCISHGPLELAAGCEAVFQFSNDGGYVK